MKSTSENSWQLLAHHYSDIKNQHMRRWFQENPQRFSQFSVQCGNILFDYSRNRILPHTLELLCQLAHQMQLPQKIDALFSGKPINTTEKRPALHTALRNPQHTPIIINNENVSDLIQQAQTKMRLFVNAIHTKQWRGATQQAIAHIINIGIGGSHTGPMMSTYALKEFAVTDLTFHFISSVDKTSLEDTFKKINPEQALFIISSKSFSTLETLTNANTILAWMKDKLGPAAIKHHFIGITAAPEKAIAWGLPEANIFPLWDWVGGRYSIWSPIGLPLMLMIGEKQFADFLQGAYEIDQHFKYSDFKKNIPVLLALLSIWYVNFFETNAQAVIPYTHSLRYLIPYLQQAEMESNGKCITLEGEEIYHGTAPIIFGEEGCNGQHTYHQLLHQSPYFVPADFILVAQSTEKPDHHQDILIASALSQADALMQGKTYEEAYSELKTTDDFNEASRYLALHKMIPGNRPSNIILMERLTPKNLGAILALYEHKIFVEGVIWRINSFDQWGVELGKQLLPNLLKKIQEQTAEHSNSPSHALINHIKKMREKYEV